MQAQLAERMHTTQSVIARLEGGQVQLFNPNARPFCQSNGYAAENQLWPLQRLIDAENARW